MKGLEILERTAEEKGWNISPGTRGNYSTLTLTKLRFRIEMEFFPSGSRLKSADISVEGRIVSSTSSLREVTAHLEFLENWPSDEELGTWPLRVDTQYGDVSLFCDAYVMYQTVARNISYPTKCWESIYSESIQDIRRALARHIALTKHVNPEEMPGHPSYGAKSD